MAEVVGGDLVAYAETSTDSTVVDKIAEGRVVWIHAEQQFDGGRWFRIQFAHVGWQGQDMFAWTSADDHLRAVELSCPPDPDVAALGAMSAQEHLNCFGEAELTLAGFATRIPDAEPAYSGTPGWIAEPSSLVLRGSDAPQADTGQLGVHIGPSAGVNIPIGAWVEVVGHFDDPVASLCEREPTTAGVSVEAPDEQVHYCRQRFVVTQARVVERPTFPTPAPDARRGHASW